MLITFNGELTKVEELGKPKKSTETLNNGDIVYICEVEIEANVEPIKQIVDPNFNFTVELNSLNFKDIFFVLYSG